MSNEEKILALLEKHGEMLEKHGEMLERLDERSQRTALILDTDIRPQLQLLHEGHQAILDKLTPREEIEAIKTDISVLKVAIRTLTAELAELKQAP